MREDLADAIPRFGALIFDVDGVLLDVSESYYTLGADTVQYYFKDWLGWPGSAAMALDKDFAAFNKIPGFNDVVDMVKALILFYLWKAEREGTNDIDRLVQAPPSLEQFRAELVRRGGGPRSAVSFVGESWAAALSPDIFDFHVALQYFVEQYAGSDSLNALTGREPRFNVTDPYFKRERILVDPELFPPRLPFGIITGRRRWEVELGREHLALSESLLPWDHVVCSDSPRRKPDPEALRLVMARLNAENVLYFGDTVDDFVMVQRYDASRGPGDPVCFFAGVTKSRDSMRELFSRYRVPMIAPRANAVLRFLHGVSQGGTPPCDERRLTPRCRPAVQTGGRVPLRPPHS